MLVNILNKKWIKKLENKFKDRSVFSKQDFIKELSKKDSCSKEIINIVYDRVFNYLPKSVEKNMCPNDNIIDDYDIDEEDLEDLLVQIFKNLKVSFPKKKE